MGKRPLNARRLQRKQTTRGTFGKLTQRMPGRAFGIISIMLSRVSICTILNRKRVFEYAAHRLPAIYEKDPYVRDGGPHALAR
jgi:hypothetical protein